MATKSSTKPSTKAPKPTTIVNSKGKTLTLNPSGKSYSAKKTVKPVNSFTNKSGQKIVNFSDKSKSVNGVKGGSSSGGSMYTPPTAQKNAAGIIPSSARGDEFAPAFEAAGGVKKGKSITETLDYRAGQTGGGNALARASALAASQAKSSAGPSAVTGATAGSSMATGGVSTRQKTREETIAEIMAKANGLLPEIEKLREREKTAAGEAVVSDTPAVKEEDKSKTKITDAAGTSPTQKALEALTNELNDNKTNLRENIKAIGKDYSVLETGMKDTQARETGALSAGLANAGGYLGFSGSGQGVMLTLANSHRAELTALDAKRINAIQTAKNAAADRKWDIVKAQADEIARIDQETYERQEVYNERVLLETQKEKIKAEEMKVEQDIFGEIQKGAKTPEAIFKALKGTVPINSINDFLEGIDKSSAGNFKFSAPETASLLGSGMSADDISALNEFVNENGYTEEVRSNLTPTQRVAADKIYRKKTGGDVNETAFTYDGYNVSETTMQVLDGFTKLSSLTPTAAQKVKKDLYKMGFGEKTPPSWFDQSFAEDVLGGPLTRENLAQYYGMPGPLDLSQVKTYTTKTVRSVWEDFRDSILSEDEVVKSSASAGGLPANLSDVN